MSTRTLRGLTWLLVGFIALIAFAVSFEAISTYAGRVGAFPVRLQWCAPLLVDLFTVTACLVILLQSRDGERALYAWALVTVASAVSVAMNIAHAPPVPSARLVATLPPAALLASLELVMSEARRARRAQPVNTGQGTIAQPKAARVTKRAPSAFPTGESRQRVEAMVLANPEVTIEEVVAATGVGKRRAYALRASAQQVHNNGQHTKE